MPTDPPVKWQVNMSGPGGNLQEDEVEDVIRKYGCAVRTPDIRRIRHSGLRCSPEPYRPNPADTTQYAT